MDKALAMKIWSVMDESEKLEKSMTVGKGTNSYSAISEADVLNGIKPLLKKFKLIIIPVDVEITELTDFYQTSSTYNGKTTVNDKARLMTQLKTKWKVVDAETGESEILAAPGNGADPQDKGSGKAWTYAYKNLIQKTFCLFSGEDTDNTHSNDINQVSSQEPKITTEQLEKVLGDNVDATIKHYIEKTGDKITELKFMKQEWKRAYYDRAKEKQHG